MNPPNLLPQPFVSAWDPSAAATGSIDPLGALRPFTAIAGTLLPGVTTITSRVRYLSWVCAGLRVLDTAPNAPVGGRAGRARRQRILAWERMLALATGVYAKAEGLPEGDPAWRQLRGVSYVRRAVAEGFRSPGFAMLRNQAGVGGIGTYWVTLVAGGLVEDEAGALTPRGQALADAFLKQSATPEMSTLGRIVSGKDIAVPEPILAAWGRVAHLGAPTKLEQRLLADAMLEPSAHRRMASALATTGDTAANADSFRRLQEHLASTRDPLSVQLSAVLAVALAFEDVHRELLYRFNQILAAGHVRPVPLKSIQLSAGRASLEQLGVTLTAVLDKSRSDLPRTVAEAVQGFYSAVAATLRARNDAELGQALISHHERVQAGKLDASRQPKACWVEIRGGEAVVSPRFALEARPEPPSETEFTHPYRVEQFTNMLREAGK